MRSILLCFLLLCGLGSFAQDSTIVVKADSLLKNVTAKDTSKVFLKTLAKTFGLRPYEANEKPRIAFVRSLFLPGWGQYTNRDYWKMGIVYAGAGAGYYFGAYTNNKRYKKYLGHYTRATLLSRGLVFKDDTDLTATNALSSSFLFYLSNDKDNSTFYLQNSEGVQYTLEEKKGLVYGETKKGNEEVYFIAHETEGADVIGSFDASTFKSAKDQYRRWRDASVIGFAAGWLFFALEANVAAHLKTFDMSEDISWKISPAGPETFGMHASGIKLAFNFK